MPQTTATAKWPEYLFTNKFWQAGWGDKKAHKWTALADGAKASLWLESVLALVCTKDVTSVFKNICSAICTCTSDAFLL